MKRDLAGVGGEQRKRPSDGGVEIAVKREQ